MCETLNGGGKKEAASCNTVKDCTKYPSRDHSFHVKIVGYFVQPFDLPA
jgi:hypothetical protein